MKTIEEAAHEYFRRGQLGLAEPDSEAGFIAGVEFAQRWISVDEELPNKYVVVMAKVEYNSLIIEDIICLCYRYNNEWYFKSNNGLASSMKFTHWRHIELKKTYNGL
ncbi:MAG: DUF551 domain-containing protein [Dysgonamonadaceae bacterium]|jgi:hypothetical protein|nr:DUF551 domain-containing protein [Dysgonamonadaceae bacterium]